LSTLSLHDALPISTDRYRAVRAGWPARCAPRMTRAIQLSWQRLNRRARCRATESSDAAPCSRVDLAPPLRVGDRCAAEARPALGSAARLLRLRHDRGPRRRRGELALLVHRRESTRGLSCGRLRPPIWD